GRSIAGQALSVPAYPQILRPAAADRRELLRVHARASRIAETSPNRIINPEVVRALDQELITLLISCRKAVVVSNEDEAEEEQAQLCVHYEELLNLGQFQLVPTKEICRLLAVSPQRFRASCLRVLGMGPGRYQKLRRLKLVRADLTRAGAQRPNV